MNDLNNIQKLWSNQEPQKKNDNTSFIKDEAKRRMAKSGKQLVWGIIVLSATAIVLASIIYKLPNLKWPFGPGLLVMFLSVTLRSTLEIVSLIWKQKLNISLPPQQYKAQISKFYKTRKWLTTKVTFATLILYVGGFSIMIPAFYSYMPTIQFAAIIVFLVVSIPLFSIFLIRKSKQELKELNEILMLIEE